MRDDVTIPTSWSVNGWKAIRVPNTSITTTRSESESRQARSTYVRRRWDIPWDDLPQSVRLELADFYDGRIATTYSFTLWDRDYNYINANQIAVGDGVATAFQITVRVGDATRNFQKPVWAPVATGTAIPVELAGLWPGTTVTSWTVTVNGAAQVEGTDFTIDPASGLITFAVAVDGGYTIVVTGWYFHVVRFDGPEFEFDLDGIYGKIQTQLLEVFNE